ncbi:MAG: hypothetical protein HEQ39_15515 [Rhizobacter sp.]
MEVSNANSLSNEVANLMLTDTAVVRPTARSQAQKNLRNPPLFRGSGSVLAAPFKSAAGIKGEFFHDWYAKFPRSFVASTGKTDNGYAFNMELSGASLRVLTGWIRGIDIPTGG